MVVVVISKGPAAGKTTAETFKEPTTYESERNWLQRENGRNKDIRGELLLRSVVMGKRKYLRQKNGTWKNKRDGAGTPSSERKQKLSRPSLQSFLLCRRRIYLIFVYWDAFLCVKPAACVASPRPLFFFPTFPRDWCVVRDYFFFFACLCRVGLVSGLVSEKDPLFVALGAFRL